MRSTPAICCDPSSNSHCLMSRPIVFDPIRRLSIWNVLRTANQKLMGYFEANAKYPECSGIYYYCES